MKDTGNRFKDLRGKVFSRLTVLGAAGKDKYGRYKWNCLCECGSNLVVASRSLLSRNTESCGCLLIKGTLHAGVGVYEKGSYKTSQDGGVTKEYRLWVDMLRRCYDVKIKEAQPTYEHCVTSENFKNFQYFAAWCNQQTGFAETGWQLDKDLLGDGITYSETNCCFLPRVLNLRIRKFNGVYKTVSGKYSSSYCGRYLGVFKTEDEANAEYCAEYRKGVKSLLGRYRATLCDRAINKLEELCN